jgi:hypothetical protein
MEVHLNGPLAAVDNSLHNKLICDERLAGVAHFPVAWTTPESRDAIQRKAAAPDLLADESTNFDFHWWPTSDRRQEDAKFTTVLTPGASTMRPRCRQ